MSVSTKRRSRIRWTQWLRRLTQVGFLAFILIAAVRHNLGEEASTASIDALCPFGGVETLWRTITTGQYIPKTHGSNIVLGIGLLLGTVVAGAAFCGWICPFGTLQDGLTWLRGKFRLPEVRVPKNVDRWLRLGRYVTLALILYMTISTIKLWFADFDPYRTIFGLGWLFEFDLATQWPAYAVALAILGGSFIIPRFWCKYLCPLGGILTLLQNVSFLRIRRNDAVCKHCAVCDKPCPVNIKVSTADTRVSTNCIGCLACVDACPAKGALEVQVAPVWIDGLKRLGGGK